MPPEYSINDTSRRDLPNAIYPCQTACAFVGGETGVETQIEWVSGILRHMSTPHTPQQPKLALATNPYSATLQ